MLKSFSIIQKRISWTIVPALIAMISACGLPNAGEVNHDGRMVSDTVVYTAYSDRPNPYRNFNSPAAINRIAQIENQHFRDYASGLSRYYGTVWREWAELDSTATRDGSLYDHYLRKLGGKADSMHCTIYAVEALMAGFGKRFDTLEKSHRRVWKEREHAGWSIAYLLVEEWNWKAYLVLDSNSAEFAQCSSAFRRQTSYPVWKQPDIPLEGMFIRGIDDSLIVQLLDGNEFGWGFSHQGIHTWITRFRNLKECNWGAAPGMEFELFSGALFKETPFLDYHDYASHVIVFPPPK